MKKFRTTVGITISISAIAGLLGGLLVTFLFIRVTEWGSVADWTSAVGTVTAAWIGVISFILHFRDIRKDKQEKYYEMNSLYETLTSLSLYLSNKDVPKLTKWLVIKNNLFAIEKLGTYLESFPNERQSVAKIIQVVKENDTQRDPVSISNSLAGPLLKLKLKVDALKHEAGLD